MDCHLFYEHMLQNKYKTLIGQLLEFLWTFTYLHDTMIKVLLVKNRR